MTQPTPEPPEAARPSNFESSDLVPATPLGAGASFSLTVPLWGRIAVQLPQKSKRVKTMADLERDDLEQKIAQRRNYARWALFLVFVQIAVADVAFFEYGHAMAWKLPVSAINGWLSATVVETIGIVLVIVRSLFPNGAAPQSP